MRWSRDAREGDVLHVDARVTRSTRATERVGSAGHRLYLGFVVALAFAEKRRQLSCDSRLPTTYSI
jgi:hypothetical protein